MLNKTKKAKRAISKDNYINVDWLVDAFGKRCSRCGCSFDFGVSTTYNVNCDLTADRIDNEIGHELDNITPMCITCNTSKSNN